MTDRLANDEDFEREHPFWWGQASGDNLLACDADLEAWRNDPNQYLYSADLVKINSAIRHDKTIKAMVHDWDFKDYPAMGFYFRAEHYDSLLQRIETVVKDISLRYPNYQDAELDAREDSAP